MTSSTPAPRRKEEFVEALLPLTKLDRSDLQTMTLEKVRVVWLSLRPSKKISVAMAQGRQVGPPQDVPGPCGDLFLQSCFRACSGPAIVWRWNSISTRPGRGGAFVSSTWAGNDSVDKQVGWVGCVRPMTVGGNPSPVVQKALKTKEKEQYFEWLANRKEKKNPECFGGYKVPVLDQDEEMKGIGPWPSQGHKGLQSTNGGGEQVDKGV